MASIPTFGGLFGSSGIFPSPFEGSQFNSAPLDSNLGFPSNTIFNPSGLSSQNPLGGLDFPQALPRSGASPADLAAFLNSPSAQGNEDLPDILAGNFGIDRSDPNAGIDTTITPDRQQVLDERAREEEFWGGVNSWPSGSPQQIELLRSAGLISPDPMAAYWDTFNQPAEPITVNFEGLEGGGGAGQFDSAFMESMMSLIGGLVQSLLTSNLLVSGGGQGQQQQQQPVFRSDLNRLGANVF